MYDYDMLRLDIGTINPITTEISTIGKSVMGRNIFCLKTGRGKRKIVITGAHSGLEFTASQFLIKFQKEYIKSILDNSNIYEFDTRNLFQNITLYIVPMVNPDGVDIAVNGLDITNEFHRKLISMVGIHSFKRVWKPNANGVELPSNCCSIWHNTIENPKQSMDEPKIDCCEPETKSIFDFLNNINPDYLITFHSIGNEIFYDFDGLAKNLNEETTKKYFDWFSDEYENYGFSIAIGNDEKLNLNDDSIDEYKKNSIFILDFMENALKK